MKPIVLFLLVITVAVLAVGAVRQRTRASDVAVMAMSPHMDMTLKRAMQPGDQARADAILAALKPVMRKYADLNVAIADGFVENNPQLRAPDAHFTNMAYAKEAWFGHFDPAHPTSLMYHRAASGWVLEGAMYTASTSASQAQLNADVPLSIAQWHRHVNICYGPHGTPLRAYFGSAAQFGLLGSIADANACAAAGGIWKAQIYGWMLHVWPMQTDPAKIWALHPDGSGENGQPMQMKIH